MGYGAPDGVSEAHHTMVVIGKDGAFRKLDLPAFKQVSVTLGNNSMNTKVPESDTRAVAVCERGMVVVTNNRIVVYDTSLSPRFTPAFLGHADTVTRATSAAVTYSVPRENPELDAKFQAAVDAAQPKTQVRYARVIVSADGYLWHGLSGKLDGRYVRTTASGAVIDTVLAPYHVMHADGDATIAIGTRRDDEDLSPSIFRPRVRKSASARLPVSELGRCNAVVQL
jgi:hypothetical protein